MKKVFSYRIEYETDKETGQVVASIPELNHISSFGESFAEAESNVREAAIGYQVARKLAPKTNLC